MATVTESIRFAEQCDKDEIIRLWHDVFGDSREYIDRFLTEYNALKYALAVFGTNFGADGARQRTVKAALFMLPVKLVCKGALPLDGRYIYAVMTDKNHRSEGLCTALMKRAHEIAEENGEHFCVLVPAESSLFGFYERFGYKPNGLNMKSIDIKAADIVDSVGFDVSKCSFEEFVNLHDEYFSKKAYFKWDKTALKYNYCQTNGANGKILKISSPKHTFYAVCYKQGDCVTIRESSIPERYLKQASLAAMRYFESESCVVKAEGGFTNYAAAKSLSQKAEKIFAENDVFLGFAME